MKLHRNFKTRHDRWLADNVSREQSKAGDDWMTGKVEGLKSCTTLKNTFKHGGLPCNLYSARYSVLEQHFV